MGRYLETCRGCGKPRNAETTGTFVNYRGERVLRSRCLECTAAYTRAWRRTTPTWDAAKTRARQDYAQRKAADPEYNRWRDLKSHYGLDRQGYDALLASQGGVCGVCGGPPNGRWSIYHVDHCHRTGKIRGLLCVNCNAAIGMVDDNIERLRQLISYLERH